MKHLEDRLVHELGEIADQAATSPDALPLIQSRASSYRPDDDEEVVVMLTHADRPHRRRRPRMALALGAVAAMVLVAFGVVVLRSGSDDIATVDSTPPTEVPVTIDPTIPTDTAATVDPTIPTETAAADTADTTTPTETAATADTTATSLAAEPWIGPPLDGEWVEVAAGEPWGPALVGEIAALPGGGYVTLTKESPFVTIAEQDGFSIPTMMWSPDGVEWFEGDPERSIRRPMRLAPPQLAVVGDRVAVVDGTDFSDHVPLVIGDPRTGSWEVVALDYTTGEAGIGMVSLAASDDVVLVAAYSHDEKPGGMMEVVTWVVDPTTGTSETASFTVANQGEDDTGAPLGAWVDGRWILFAYEDPPESEGGERGHRLWTSSDGLTWSQVKLASGLGVYYEDGFVCSLAVGPMGVVARTCPIGMGLHPVPWYSADGLEWNRISQVDRCYGATDVGDYGFVISGEDPAPLQLLTPDGSGMYQMSASFEDVVVAASSGDTLLVSTGKIYSGFWLYSPS